MGNYFANRGRDLGECVRAEAGVGLGLGAGGRGAGIVDVGLEVLISSTSVSAAWLYGTGYAAECRPHAEDLFGRIHLPGFFTELETQNRAPRTVGAIGVPSALFSYRVGWIWSERGSRWDRLHAFDVEAHAHFVLVGCGVGFSPGEFLDFLLGWFGVDIAGDDRALAATEPAG